MHTKVLKNQNISLTNSFSYEINKCFRHTPQIIINLAIILSCLQIFDGCLTSIGVQTFGIEAEGNPLLKEFMLMVGSQTALLACKSLAILVIAYLASISHIVKWIKHALSSIIGVYALLAIIPWINILSSHYLA